MRAVALCALMCAAACDVGTGTGAVDGSLFIRQCAAHTEVGAAPASGTSYSFGSATAPQTYDMHPSFFAAEPIDDFERLDPNNRLDIRVQSEGSRIEAADVLIIDIASVYDIAVALNQDIAVSYNTNLRATLSLEQSCPMPEVTPTLEGTINFSTFGQANLGHIQPDFRVGFGDALHATFDFNVIDVRAATLGGQGNVPIDPAIGGHITGFFDFVVRQGQRAQSYP